jgi:hypothetical protein
LDSYQPTTGGILQKIRTALQQRDDGYELSTGVIELDGATFGCREAGNQGDSLVPGEVDARELRLNLNCG